MSQQTWNESGWVDCVGHLDGTLFPLCHKPQSEDCGDHHGRNLGYTMSTLIASDKNLFGWPGYTHNDRIAAHSKLWKDSKKNHIFRAFTYGLCFLSGRKLYASLEKSSGTRIG